MFTRIRAKNLFSWESLDYTVPSGISQVVGFNADDGTNEGAGKSSLMNIVCWTLYGEIPKEDVRIDDCVREGTKEAEGRVTLHSGLEVIRRRGRNPGIFTIWNGKEEKISQSELDKKIISFSLFCQNVYFPQNYTKRFVLADAETKAKILTEARDIALYDRARKITEDRLQESKKQFDTSSTFLKSLEDQIRTSTKDLQTAKNDLEIFEKNKHDYLLSLNEQIEQLSQCKEVKADEDNPYNHVLKVELEELTFMIRQHQSLIQEREQTLKKIKESHQSIKYFEDQIQKLKSKTGKSDFCPVCKQAVNQSQLETHLQEIKQEIKNFRLKIEAIEAEIPAEPQPVADLGQVQQRRDEVDKLIKIQEKEQLEIEKSNAVYRAAKEQIKNLKSKIKQEKVKTPDNILERIAELEDRLQFQTDSKNIREKEVVKYQEDVRQCTELRKAFKDIKSDIFQTALNELTRYSNQYLQDLFSSFVKIRFENVIERNVVKIKTFITIDGKERAMGLYSGGQFRRVSIAVDLALAKMVSQRGGKHFNTRFLDEPMKDLSTPSKFRVLELIKTLPGNTVLIEHDPAIQTAIDKKTVIHFKDGVSTLEEEQKQA